MSQQVNNLEEKMNVLDTFSQSIYNYVSSKEDKEKEDVITYSNQDIKEQEKLIKQKISQSLEGLINAKNTNISENINTPALNTNQEDSETENESNQYNVNQPVNQFEDKLTENFESKEILSEMVSQLKETLIENDKLEEESNETEPEVNVELQTETQPNELYNLLNNTFNTDNNTLKEFEQSTNKVNTKIVDNKKKEEELMKMKLQDLKNLAKKKNIKVVDTSNKPKKKETLVMELLNH
jgi:hypothetical protein